MSNYLSFWRCCPCCSRQQNMDSVDLDYFQEKFCTRQNRKHSAKKSGANDRTELACLVEKGSGYVFEDFGSKTAGNCVQFSMTTDWMSAARKKAWINAKIQGQSPKMSTSSEFSSLYSPSTKRRIFLLLSKPFRTRSDRRKLLNCTSGPDQVIKSDRQMDSSLREENSLQLWIFAAKGIAPKKQYFCEVCLDSIRSLKTTTKTKSSDECFWGEHFELNRIPKLSQITINLYKDFDVKKRKSRGNNLVGFVDIPAHSITARYPVEKWYPVTFPSVGSKLPSISLRIKARFQTVSILPLRAYEPMLEFLKFDYLAVCAAVESLTSVKAKEDIATCIVRIMHNRNLAKDFLCDLVMQEVHALDNFHLMFRGNSLATKAMEAYMKIVGEDYLKDTLSEFVEGILTSKEAYEVDPSKIVNLALLSRHRECLMDRAKEIWKKIVSSAYDFPRGLKKVFCELRQRLESEGCSEFADYLISSNIFLRFLCPAIMSPSLFRIVKQYPNEASVRNLTLIAKTVQTLANFTKFGVKEPYMSFMNQFVEAEMSSMRNFLRLISSDRDIVDLSVENCDFSTDLAKQSSMLHSYLSEICSSAERRNAPATNPSLISVVQLIDRLVCVAQNRLISTTNTPPSATLSCSQCCTTSRKFSAVVSTSPKRSDRKQRALSSDVAAISPWRCDAVEANGADGDYAGDNDGEERAPSPYENGGELAGEAERRRRSIWARRHEDLPSATKIEHSNCADFEMKNHKNRRYTFCVGSRGDASISPSPVVNSKLYPAPFHAALMSGSRNSLVNEAALSSGYHSLNYSTSNSSSPVENASCPDCPCLRCRGNVGRPAHTKPRPLAERNGAAGSSNAVTDSQSQVRQNTGQRFSVRPTFFDLRRKTKKSNYSTRTKDADDEEVIKPPPTKQRSPSILSLPTFFGGSSKKSLKPLQTKRGEEKPGSSDCLSHATTGASRFFTPPFSRWRHSTTTPTNCSMTSNSFSTAQSSCSFQSANQDTIDSSSELNVASAADANSTLPALKSNGSCSTTSACVFDCGVPCSSNGDRGVALVALKTAACNKVHSAGVGTIAASVTGDDKLWSTSDGKLASNFASKPSTPMLDGNDWSTSAGDVTFWASTSSALDGGGNLPKNATFEIGASKSTILAPTDDGKKLTGAAASQRTNSRFAMHGLRDSFKAMVTNTLPLAFSQFKATGRSRSTILPARNEVLSVEETKKSQDVLSIRKMSLNAAHDSCLLRTENSSDLLSETTPQIFAWSNEDLAVEDRLESVKNVLKLEQDASLRKQRIIKAQQQRISVLQSTNEKLLHTLHALKLSRSKKPAQDGFFDICSENSLHRFSTEDSLTQSFMSCAGSFTTQPADSSQRSLSTCDDGLSTDFLFCAADLTADGQSPTFGLAVGSPFVQSTPNVKAHISFY